MEALFLNQFADVKLVGNFSLLFFSRKYLQLIVITTLEPKQSYTVVFHNRSELESKVAEYLNSRFVDYEMTMGTLNNFSYCSGCKTWVEATNIVPCK